MVHVVDVASIFEKGGRFMGEGERRERGHHSLRYAPISSRLLLAYNISAHSTI